MVDGAPRWKTATALALPRTRAYEPVPACRNIRRAGLEDFYRRRARVLAAFFAAARRLAGPLVRTAFLAEADRLAAVRRRAAERACFANDWGEAALRPSRLSRFSIARERRGEVFFLPPLLAFRVSRAAARRVCSEAVPFLGGLSFTPARRALDRPMAIACWVERAPCFPSRM